MRKEIALENIAEWWDDDMALKRASAEGVFDAGQGPRIYEYDLGKSPSPFYEHGCPQYYVKGASAGSLRYRAFKSLIAAPKKMDVTLANESEWRDDVEAMQSAFDWDADEIRELADAYYADVCKHEGSYIDVLRNVVRNHIVSAPVEDNAPQQMEESAPQPKKPSVTLQNIQEWWDYEFVMEGAFDWTSAEQQKFKSIIPWGNSQASRDSYDVKYDIQNLRVLVFSRLIAAPKKMNVALANESEWQDDVEAMQSAFDWSDGELCQLAYAYYKDVCWNAGHYKETLQRLVHARLDKMVPSNSPCASQKDEKPVQSEYVKNERTNRHEPLATSASPNEALSKEESNRRIRKRVMWFVLGALGVIAVIILAKYWLTGSVVIFVGTLTAVISRNLRSAMADYEYKLPYGFRVTLALVATIGTVSCFVVCQWFSKAVYAMSDGAITPWRLFVIVLVVMAVIFIVSYIHRNSGSERKYRLCIFLMVVSCSLTLSQCVGSICHSSDIKDEQWRKEMKMDDASRMASAKEKIVGTWVTKDVLGRQMTETFHADGTWTQEYMLDDGCQRVEGRWTLLSRDRLEITKFSNGAPSDKWIRDDLKLEFDWMTCQRGDYPLAYRRVVE